MEFALKASHQAAFEARLASLAPWMHPYKFGANTFTGYFKYDGVDITWTSPASSTADQQRLRAAYEKFTAHEEWSAFLRSLLIIGAGPLEQQTAIDIGAGGGLNSFLTMQAGLGSVTAVEIRENQSAQLQAILDAVDDPRIAGRVRAVHDPTSADDPAFADRYAGAFDVALSFGVLYHLANPWQHLVNLRRIARRRAIIYTMTHQYPLAKQLWAMTPEQAGWITKATSGISWTPYYGEVARLCQLAGFRRITIHYADRFARHFPDFAAPPSRRRDLARVAELLWLRATGQRLGTQRNHDPGYFRDAWLNPNYFAYVCEV